jgi:hypothetical protein
MRFFLRALFFTIMILPTAVGLSSAQEPNADEAVVQTPAQEPAGPPEPEEPKEGLTAELTTKTADTRGIRVEMLAKFYRLGKRVRIEQIEEGTKDVSVLDFKKLKEYRLYYEDRYYFESDLTTRARARAEREAKIPLPDIPELLIERLPLGPAEFDGHPCRLTLLVRTVKDEEGKRVGRSEYTLWWEATDLDNFPVRVAYIGSGGVTTVLEYSKVQIGPLDKTLFEMPAEFLSMSPF